MRLRMRRDLAAAVLLPITLLLIGGCQTGWAQTGRYAYHPPTQEADGWQTASLEDVGMDTGRMIGFMNALAGHPDHWVHSVVVVWNGTRVVSERWVTPSTRKVSDVGPSESPVPGLNPSYGLLWWRGTLATGKTDTYFAAGRSPFWRGRLKTTTHFSRT
ncbi:MAG TPA: hypothetical protein VLA36_16655 [Longimicrobiales bacterium]|nr:hypothetical protein [Longimicrobiales bacterium]